MKNRNLFLTVLFSAIIFVWIHPHTLSAQGSSVQIIDKGNYYQVTMDYTSGIILKQSDLTGQTESGSVNNSTRISHYNMGVQLGQKILQTKPDYEQLLDSYIAEYDQQNYDTFMCRVHDIKPQIPQAFQDEIDGIASQLSGGDVNVKGDNKLSKDEFYLVQLFNDIACATQCSGISVYGIRSETGHPITARIHDLGHIGANGQLAQIQAVTTINYGSKSICMIGYLGHLVLITGFNSNGVFAGVMDSGTGAPYSSKDKYSYATDLRYALENSTTLNDVASYMTNPSRNYTYNHNVLLSDSQTSKVLENNFSGSGTNMQRALRSDTSALNPGITWGFTDAVAAVNSFLLPGNHDNHTISGQNMIKWENIKTQLQYYGETITFEELKLIASFDNGDGPDWSITGDIYNASTQQIILFEPDTFHLEVAFSPKSGALPTDPVFENIPIEWNIKLAYGHSLETDKKAPRTVNDTITIKATVENPCAHEISAMLIFENPDCTIVDSVEMFPVNLATSKSWQVKWITKNLPEDMYWLSLKVKDITDGTFFTNKHLTRITNIPLFISGLTFKKTTDNKYTLQTQLKNGSKSMTVSNLAIKLASNDNCVTSISPDQVSIDGIRAGQIKRIPASSVYVDENTFPNHLNLTYTISKNDCPYWVIDTTLYAVTTGIEQIGDPLKFNLEQNFPNPFNSVTTIPWQISENSKVTLKVLDIVGRTVTTLVNEQREQGKYATRFDAATLPKGIYFCQLKAGKNIQTRKIILLD